MHFTQQYTYTTCHSSHTHMGHAKHKTHNTQQNNMLIIDNTECSKHQESSTDKQSINKFIIKHGIRTSQHHSISL